MSWSSRRMVLAALLAVTVAGLHAAEGDGKPAADSRQAYADKIRSSYHFAFGSGNIAAPGDLQVEGNDFLSPQTFPSAEYCGHCHSEAYRQWRESLHANSFREPFYRTSVNILPRTKGIEFTRHCDSCHNPIGVAAGELTENSQADRRSDTDGVTCMVCHSIQKLQPEEGNGSVVLGVPAVMVDEKGEPIRGPVSDDEILKYPERHARAVMKDFYHTAQFCGACHKANLPKGLNDYKWIRAFTTYDEWQDSKFSGQTPLPFYTAAVTRCQDCHMPRGAAPASEYGAKHGMFASHRWAAGNTAVPFYYGFTEQLEKTVEFLKSGMYLNVDLFGLKPAGGSMIAPLGTKPFSVSAGQTVQVLAVIQNKNIGHSLVPEVRDLYEAWVEFEATDGAGRVLAHSGFLKPDGMLDERAHSFTNRPVNLYGDFVDDHQVWTIHSMAYDNTIQSGRSALVRYAFRIPGDAKSPIQVTAKVNYRHIRQSYTNHVFGPDHPAYPVVELGSQTRQIVLGSNAPTPPGKNDNPDWMRWNNFGIALMDQQQYAEALDAFEQVVALRPDYADGYINVALDYLSWEKYAEARPGLEKALALNPRNARALYYLALVERREHHPEAERADLESVVERYPGSRDARRELGIAYYQEHNYAAAREQFEALQTIDPDDLAAHYNLALIYRRLGMKQKAAEQAALFALKQIDPGAPTYSLNFLRNHPEISRESVPWHENDETGTVSHAAVANMAPNPYACGGSKK